MVRVHFSPPSDASQFFRKEKLQKHRMQNEVLHTLEGGRRRKGAKQTFQNLMQHVP